MMTRSMWSAGVLACALAALTPSPVFADGSFPGVMCQASGSAQDLYYSTSSIANRTAATSSAVCPIPRNAVTAAATSISVDVRNRHETEEIRCTAASVSTTGDTGWLQNLSTSGTGFHTLTFNGITATNWGAYSVVCALPPMVANVPSYLATYRINEP